MAKVVGYSLTFCIQDLIAGRVKVEDVEKIVASTRFGTEEAWEVAIVYYRKVYWKTNPDLGEAFCRQLLAAGKIEQPRLVNPNHWHDIGLSPSERWHKA